MSGATLPLQIYALMATTNNGSLNEVQQSKSIVTSKDQGKS